MSTTSSEIPTQPPNKLFESDSEGSEDEQKEDGSVYEPSGSEFEDNDDENDNGDGTDGDGTDGVGTDNEGTDSRDQSDNVPETETEEEEEPEPDITEEEMLAAIRMLRDSLNGLKTDLVEFTGAAVAGMVGDHNSQMDKFISGEDEREDDDEDLSQAIDRMAARNATFGLGMAVSVGGGGSYSPQVPTSSGILASGGSSNVSAMSTPSYSSQDDQDYPFVPPSQPSSSMSPFKKAPGTPKKMNNTPKKEEVVTPKKELFSPKKEVLTPKKETSTPKKAASTPKKKTPKKSPKNASAAEAEHELLKEIKVEVKDEPEDNVMEIVVLNDGTVCNKKMDNVCNCPLDHGTPTRSTRSAKKSR